MGPLVLWSRVCHGADREPLGAAAASVARLTHSDPEVIAGAVIAALAWHEVFAEGGVPPDWMTRLQAGLSVARRWTGVFPSSGLIALLATLAETESPNDPPLVRGLRAIGKRDLREVDAAPELVRSLDHLDRLGDPY
jgi:hypothetical protein